MKSFSKKQILLLCTGLVCVPLFATGCAEKDPISPNPTIQLQKENPQPSFPRGKFGEAVSVGGYVELIPKDDEKLNQILNYLDNQILKEQKGFQLKSDNQMSFFDVQGNSRLEYTIFPLKSGKSKESENKTEPQKEPFSFGMDFIGGQLYRTFPAREVRSQSMVYGTTNPVTTPDVGTMHLIESFKELNHAKRYYAQSAAILSGTHFEPTKDIKNPPRGIYLTNRETKVENLHNHLIGEEERKIWVDAFFYFDSFKNQYKLRLSVVGATDEDPTSPTPSITQEWVFEPTDEILKLYPKQISKEEYNKLFQEYQATKNPLPENIGK